MGKNKYNNFIGHNNMTDTQQIQLNTLKFVEYGRKSTEDEDRQVASLPDQHKDLEQFTQRQNIQILNYLTESKSAKEPGREVFDQMIADIKKGKFNAILVWHANRLSRNSVDGGLLVYLMDKGYLQAIVTPRKTFYNNGDDKMTLQFEFMMSKKYTDDLSPTVRRGMKSKAEKGWTVAKPKLGYKNVTLEDDSVVQVVDENRFLLLRRVIDLLLTCNYTVTKALDVLNKKYKFTTPKTKRTGGKPLSKSRLYEILKDPYYYGDYTWGDDVHTKVHNSLPRLMTENEYWIIQKILGKKGMPRPRGEANVLAPFRGLIRCADCGSLYVPYRIFKKASNGENIERFYYRCSHDYTRKECIAEQVSLKSLNAQVLSILDSIAIPDEFFQWALKWIKEDHKQETREQEIVMDNIHRQLEQNNRKLNNLLALRIESETISSEEYDAKRKQLQAEEIDLKAQLASLETHSNNWLDLAERTFNFTQNAKYHYENGDYETKTVILRALGTQFAIENKRLYVELQKPFLEFKENKILIEKELRAFEPLDFVDVTAEPALTTAKKSTWWTVPESNR